MLRLTRSGRPRTVLLVQRLRQIAPHFEDIGLRHGVVKCAVDRFRYVARAGILLTDRAERYRSVADRQTARV